MRGYFGIGVENVSKAMNAGAVMRTAHAFGANFSFFVGSPLNKNEIRLSDTSNTENSLPTYYFNSVEDLSLPKGCKLVGIELLDNAEYLPSFKHPRLAAYILGSERYGLVAEANAIRLKPDGVFVKSEIDPANWFLADKDDVRSSYYLEDVATEYAVQGLELDWVCACWDASLRRIDNEWELYKFVGTKFQKRSQEHQRKYLLNAYRVLLTRARQGLIIFVPVGNIQDKTRDPKFYDGTYEYLINCGFSEL